MEGINYGMVVNRRDMNRTLENLLFEHARNNPGYRLNMVVTK